MSDGPKRLEVLQFQSVGEQRTDEVLRLLAEAVAIANERGSVGVHIILENPDQSFTRLCDPDDYTFMVGALHMSATRLSQMSLEGAEPVEPPTDPTDEEE